ncbi:hypothetical protein [Cryobacterium sp. Sr8]|uniref:hypothetical protein n=1 Tax=Cryobacterium sp. Sr8 TaxID=1259203 RepID=UPI001A7E64B8|nr:hypothetical protein [Cryobacterium sp. Sr8]
MIEIVVSMFLLALLSIAFLPLLIGAMKTSFTNSTIATATQMVSQQMDAARQAGDTCASLTSFGAVAVPSVTDARGVTFQASRTVANCTSGSPVFPRTTQVTVSVAVTGSSIPALSATTLVYLRAP